MANSSIRWYEGKHQDALFYLLTAIFLLELVIGGIAFFYGIIHASPEIPGGPPVARFPWLAWIISAALAPVVLILGIHLAGSLLASSLTHDANVEDAKDGDMVPESMQRFYASVRHAPIVILLCGILLIAALLYFVDGAFSSLIHLGEALLPYLPWIAVSLAGLLSICFIARCLMIYKQRKLEHEYAWRREVLEKTGLVIADKNSAALPPADALLISTDAPKKLPPASVVDIEISGEEKEEGK